MAGVVSNGKPKHYPDTGLFCGGENGGCLGNGGDGLGKKAVRGLSLQLNQLAIRLNGLL